MPEPYTPKPVGYPPSQQPCQGAGAPTGAEWTGRSEYAPAAGLQAGGMAGVGVGTWQPNVVRVSTLEGGKKEGVSLFCASIVFKQE